MVVRVLATGQSNMRGRFEGGHPPFSTATRVTVWNNVNPLGSNGTALVSPSEGSAPFNSDGSNNLALWFCHRLSQELNDDVQLILVARDSSDISFWHPSTGSLYAEILDVWNAYGGYEFDILLWHQGETGETPDNTQYKTKWIAMRNALRTVGVIKDNAPAILGGLQGARIGGTNDTYLQQLANENADVYYASSVGLDHGGDSLHFSGSALYVFGYFKYWDQYRAHIGNKPRLSSPAILAARRTW